MNTRTELPLRRQPSPRSNRRRFATRHLLDALEPRLLLSAAYIDTGLHWADANESAGAIGDFNGDGLSDIAHANETGLAVQYGQPDGTFAADVTTPATLGNYIRLFVTNLNGDNRADLVADFESGHGHGLVLFTGNASGPMAGQALPAPNGHYIVSAVAGPIGSTSSTDQIAALALDTSDHFTIDLFNGAGQLLPDAFYTQSYLDGLDGTSTIELADVNGDGYNDVVCTDPDTLAWYTALNSFSPHLAALTDVGSARVAADFTGDGKADIASIGSNGSLRLAVQQGNSSFADPVDQPVTLAAGLHTGSLFAADLNGDGQLDIALLPWFSDHDYDKVFAIHNDHGTFSTKDTVVVPNYAEKLAVGNAVGDSGTDLLVTNTGFGEDLLLYRRADAGTLTVEPTGTLGSANFTANLPPAVAATGGTVELLQYQAASQYYAAGWYQQLVTGPVTDPTVSMTLPGPRDLTTYYIARFHPTSRPLTTTWESAALTLNATLTATTTAIITVQHTADGQTDQVYVNVRHDGTEPIRAGTVEVYEDQTLLTTASVYDGVAILPASLFTPNVPRTIWARSLETATYAASDSPRTTVTVSAAPVTSPTAPVPLPDSANSMKLIVAGDVGYYVSGTTLYKTDGTVAGASVVTTIAGGAAGAGPIYDGLAVGNRAILFWNNTAGDDEVWATDGTAAGTVKLGAVSPLGAGSPYVATSDAVYWFHDHTLYRTDGTVGGTTSTALPGTPDRISVWRDMPYFVIDNAAIYHFDGSQAVLDTAYNPEYMLAAGDTLLLFHSDIRTLSISGASGFLLTDRETTYRPLASAGGYAYFTRNGQDVCRTDGTVNGTITLATFDRAPDTARIAVLGDTLLFSAYDGTRRAIWRTDGTVAGTAMVSDLGRPVYQPLPSDNNFSFLNPTVSAGLVYFTDDNTGAADPTGIELWRTDGTTAGTQLVADIYPGPASSAATRPAVLNSHIVARARDAEHGIALWSIFDDALPSISFAGAILPYAVSDATFTYRITATARVTEPTGMVDLYETQPGYSATKVATLPLTLQPDGTYQADFVRNRTTHSFTLSAVFHGDPVFADVVVGPVTYTQTAPALALDGNVEPMDPAATELTFKITGTPNYYRFPGGDISIYFTPPGGSETLLPMRNFGLGTYDAYVTVPRGVGTHTFRIVYGGDATYPATESTITYDAPRPAMALSGQFVIASETADRFSYTLHADVTGPAPHGRVDFYVGFFGDIPRYYTNQIWKADPAGGYQATADIALGPGLTSIRVEVAADTYYLAGSVATQTHTFPPQPTTISLATPWPLVAADDAVSVTATPYRVGTYWPDQLIGGPVAVSEGRTQLASADGIGDPLSFALTPLPPGLHALVADYLGAPTYYQASVSDPLTVLVTPDHNPLGAIDTLNRDHLTGWVADPDLTGSIQYRLDIDGMPGTASTADVARTTSLFVTAAPIGIDTDLALLPGSHTVQLYALDDASGDAVLVDTRTIDVPNTAPAGTADTVTADLLAGTASDADTPAAPVTVHVFVDGAAFTTFAADQGTAGHDFAFTPTGLPAGRHRLRLALEDTTDHTLTDLAQADYFINRLPIGHLDVSTTQRLAGWAHDWDTNQPLTLDIEIDGAIATTITADATRNDLAGYTGAANRGFNIPTPFLTAGTHTIQVFAHDADVADARQLIGTATVTKPNSAPVGHVDIAKPYTILGWASDRDTGSTASDVQVTIDSTRVFTITANQGRPDLQSYLGSSNHGFRFDTPSLAPGEHHIQVVALDSADGPNTTLADLTLTITSQAPIGSLDIADATRLVGWAYDANSPGNGRGPATVVATIDGNALDPVSANAYRPDLASYLGQAQHGFVIPLALTIGTHAVTLQVRDDPATALRTLATRSVTNNAPRGHLDGADSLRIIGWAADFDSPTTSINVRIDIDGQTGTPFAASATRNDLVNYVGSANHGFSVPLPTLSQGAHDVKLYAFDTVSQQAVLVGSTTLNITNAAPIGYLDAATSFQISGWAFDATTPTDPVQIRIKIDGSVVTTVTADFGRGDLISYLGSANHGFRIYTSSLNLAAGTYTVQAFALDTTTGQETLLASTKTMVIS